MHGERPLVLGQRIVVGEIVDQFFDPHGVGRWQLAGVEHAAHVAVAAGIDVNTERRYRCLGNQFDRIVIDLAITFI